MIVIVENYFGGEGKNHSYKSSAVFVGFMFWASGHYEIPKLQTF